MIPCPKCQMLNPPEQVVCERCGADLLPDPTHQKRQGLHIAGMVLGGVLIMAGVLFFRSSAVGLVSFIGAGGLVAAYAVLQYFRHASAAERYADRAAHLATVEPLQAVADLDHAIALTRSWSERVNWCIQRTELLAASDLPRAEREVLSFVRMLPEHYREDLCKRIPDGVRNRAFQLMNRANDAEQAGQTDEGTWMRLVASYVMEIAAVRLAQASYMHSADPLTSGAAEKATMDLTVRKIVNEAVAARKKLADEGKVTALGYCSTCGEGREADEHGQCPLDHHGLKGLTFAAPGELESMKADLKRYYQVFDHPAVT